MFPTVPHMQNVGKMSLWIWRKSNIKQNICGHYVSALEPGHISITFIFCASALVCPDPICPLGYLTIHAQRLEY